MDLLDGTIVNVAVAVDPRRARREPHRLQWIVGGYALTFAVGLVVGGRLGDLYGRRRLFLIGIAGFTARARCSAASRRIAGHADRLPAAAGRLRRGHDPAGLRHHPRVVPEGGDAEGVRDVRPRHRLARPCSARSSAARSSTATCSAPAGARSSSINLPLGIVAFVGALRLLPESRLSDAPPLDVARRVLVDRRLRAADLPADPGPRGGLAGVDVRDRWRRASSRSCAFAWYEARRERDRPLAARRARACSHAARTPAGVVVALVFFAGMIGLMLTMYAVPAARPGLQRDPRRPDLRAVGVGTAIGAGVGAAVLGPADRPAGAARRARRHGRRRRRDARRGRRARRRRRQLAGQLAGPAAARGHRHGRGAGPAVRLRPGGRPRPRGRLGLRRAERRAAARGCARHRRDRDDLLLGRHEARHDGRRSRTRCGSSSGCSSWPPCSSRRCPCGCAPRRTSSPDRRGGAIDTMAPPLRHRAKGCQGPDQGDWAT